MAQFSDAASMEMLTDFPGLMYRIRSTIEAAHSEDVVGYAVRELDGDFEKLLDIVLRWAGDTVITLPDGYNGDVAQFKAHPLEIGYTSVKLAVVAPASHLIRWVCKSDFLKALQEVEA